MRPRGRPGHSPPEYLGSPGVLTMGLLGRLPSRPPGDGAGNAPQAPAPAQPLTPPLAAYQPPEEPAASIAVAAPPPPPLAPPSDQLRQIRRAVVERVEAAL